ncbi:Holliday junction branch migration protein RuvA [Acetivibrio ethanolgignens]|uniref:Holliday junction branch migration complex subunit RuvA n=1 Tax=Acetivibrio ethanolgignens TaxID=290052 RepID=A0A0V8QG25_9FIRM|nr:Holliday junction branch migration protein RuvA [Acetivibrio ethanolgignens]KSV59521.1 ATP-dependent DNA helicase RuvA [Acetivibrio ethanolgignens]
MIAYIKGELVTTYSDGIVVEQNGIGYEIGVPLSVMSELPSPGEEVKIHTYLYVREDAMKLYGFLTRDDLEIFKLLITVSGIGPKGALGILSAMTPDDLRFAILAGDTKTIAKAPGIGQKTAAKLVLELKDKLNLSDAFEERLSKGSGENAAREAGNHIRNEAVEALTALGYTSTDALKAVRQVELTEGMSVEELLKQSLKYISFI